jgi:hypothetical protein
MTLPSKICWHPCKISLRLVFPWKSIYYIEFEINFAENFSRGIIGFTGIAIN